MNIFLKLSEVNIKIENYPFETLPDNFLPFVCKEVKADMVYRVHVGEEKTITGTCLVANRQIAVYQEGEELCIVSALREMEQVVSCTTVFHMKEAVADIYLPQTFFSMHRPAERFFSLLFVDYMLIDFGRIMMHCSVVEYQSEGILFTGKSGMGKSTQADLWQQYRGAHIINGDRGTLRVKPDGVEVYGSPYAGSSHIYLQEHAPVKAIILLGQGKVNTLTRLQGMKAFKELFPRFSVARFQQESLNACINLIQRIMTLVPVYKLVCYPGEEAVQLVEETLYKNVKL